MYAVPPSNPPVAGELAPTYAPPIVDHTKQIRFANFVAAEDVHPATVTMQQEATTIDSTSGFPQATPPSDILFASFVEGVQPGLAIAARETAIWRVCSILFDPLEVGCSRFVRGVPEDKVEEFAPRMRLDALGAFWAGLEAKHLEDGLKGVRAPEEKALLMLTVNDVVGACDVLVAAGDYKLATLVAQMPGSETSRAMLKAQIQVWRGRDDWSEMSDAVRALYSVLAGEVCVVEGKAGAAENRVAGFNIAERFRLSWGQSFALRLFYSGCESVEEVVEAYVADLESGREVVEPVKDWPDLVLTTDTLMELLRVAAGKQDGGDVFSAKAVSGAYFNSRLAWQLACALDARGACAVPDEQWDVLTLNFATELEAAGRLVSSAWVLLHLRHGDSRASAIDSLLERNGGLISTPAREGEERGTFEDLAEACQIPTSMLWKAKALYATARLDDPALQTLWLLEAGLPDEAHAVLCSTLGPQAVIERDFAVLEKILAQFDTRGTEGWQTGGQVYADFVALVRARRAQKSLQDSGVAVKRLSQGLARLEEEGTGDLEVRVAVQEMGRVVAEAFREDGLEQGRKEKSLRGDGDGTRMLERYRRAMQMV